MRQRSRCLPLPVARDVPGERDLIDPIGTLDLLRSQGRGSVACHWGHLYTGLRHGLAQIRYGRPGGEKPPVSSDSQNRLGRLGRREKYKAEARREDAASGLRRLMVIDLTLMSFSRLRNGSIGRTMKEHGDDRAKLRGE